MGLIDRAFGVATSEAEKETLVFFCAGDVRVTAAVREQRSGNIIRISAAHAELIRQHSTHLSSS